MHKSTDVNGLNPVTSYMIPVGLEGLIGSHRWDVREQLEAWEVAVAAGYVRIALSGICRPGEWPSAWDRGPGKWPEIRYRPGGFRGSNGSDDS